MGGGREGGEVRWAGVGRRKRKRVGMSGMCIVNDVERDDREREGGWFFKGRAGKLLMQVISVGWDKHHLALLLPLLDSRLSDRHGFPFRHFCPS